HARVELDHVGRGQLADLVTGQRDALALVAGPAGPGAGAVSGDVLHGELGAVEGELRVPATDPLTGVVGEPLAEHHAVAALGRPADHYRLPVGHHATPPDHALYADRQHLDRGARARVGQLGAVPRARGHTGLQSRRRLCD